MKYAYQGLVFINESYISTIQLIYGGMTMAKWKENMGTLTIFLQGEIDHYAAEKLRDDMEKLIGMRRPKELALDFTEVTFMDSSGIGMLIGRYKTMTSLGGRVRAYGLSAPIMRLFRMAGLHRIIPTIQDERSKEA